MIPAVFVPTKDQLRRFAPQASPEWIDAFTRLAEDLCPFYEINLRRWRHFAAQWHAETNGLALKAMRENMNFTTAARIREVYGYRLRLAIRKVSSGAESEPACARGASVASLAAACVGQPKLLADIVYGGREGTPWMQGSRYIGRGPTQITHLDDYRAIYHEILRQPGGRDCPDLVAHPEALETPEWGVRSAFADWHLKRLSRYADQDSVELVSDALNTGNVNDNIKPHGLAERKRSYSRALGVWPDMLAEGRTPTPETTMPAGNPLVLRRGDSGERVKVLQQRLSELGYHVGAHDGTFGLLTERAVIALQHEHGLKPDGVVGALTWAVIEQTARAPLGERETITADLLVKRGSTTVWWARLGKRIGQAVSTLTTFVFGDSLAGTGLIDAVLDRLSWLQQVGQRGAGLFDFFITPKGLLVLAIGGAFLAVWYIGHKIEQGEVADARTGANLAR
jgi:predicted chitinase